MKLRPFQVPDSRVNGRQPGEAGGAGAGERAELGHVDDESCGGDVRDAGDRGQDLEPALQVLAGVDDLPDLGFDALQLALDLGEPLLVESLGDGVAQVFAPVADGLPVADQCVAHQLEFGEVAVATGLRRGGTEVADRVGHGRQRPGIDGVGLGAASARASEAPDLAGIDCEQGKPGLQQGVLEVAVPGSAGLVGDAPRLRADPGDELPEPGRIIREPGRPVVGRGVGGGGERGGGGGGRSVGRRGPRSAKCGSRRRSGPWAIR